MNGFMSMSEVRKADSLHSTTTDGETNSVTLSCPSFGPFYDPYPTWKVPTASGGEKCPCCGERWKRRKGDKAKDAKSANKAKVPKRRKTGK